ncbi:MAG: DivIVA domain-containing protein [Gemmatimonadota bacterium]
MIDLTPLEVRKKKGDFRRQMRGYDPALVDDFLDLVADRLEQVVRENLTTGERLHLLEQQVADFREREKALTEALVSAQEMREDMRRQVTRENELSRREAEQQAEQIRAGALQAREREEESLRRLRARQTQLLQSYRTFLERELAELQVIAETLEVSRSIGMIPEEQSASPQPRATQAQEQVAAVGPRTIQPLPSPPQFPPPMLPDPMLEKRDHTPPQLNLVEDIDDDGEADSGWVSTLIENKG